MKQHKDGKHFGSMNNARSELLTHRRANFKRTNLHLADAGVDDVACLTSPSDSSVQYGDIDILNLHFHANSEHTQRGQQNFLLVSPLLYSCPGLSTSLHAKGHAYHVMQGDLTAQRRTLWSM
jgi:hypothetical protein